MESIRGFGRSIYKFWREVVEWRSPATAPYLMLINTAYWASVFYLDVAHQQLALVSLAAGIFSWDVLSTPSHEKSIAVHIATWPIQSLWRSFAVICSLYSVHMLNASRLEVACWASYTSVGSLLVNPVWDHYKVNHKIANCGKRVGESLKNAASVVFVSPMKKLLQGIRYIIFFEFLPDLWNCIKSGCRSIKNCFKNGIIEPIKSGFRAFGRFLRYWFCAHWWPGLKEWIILRIGGPCKRAFNYFCFCLVYLFCGHWVPPLFRWIKSKLVAFGGLLHRVFIVPAKRWMWAKFDQFRFWLRRQLHRLAVAIRDSVLWPICVLIVDIGKEICAIIYKILMKPVVDYAYQRYKIVETAALIYFLGPVCEKIVKNIPEKNPFCDESDVELEGMLPSEIEGDAEVDESYSDVSEKEYIRTPVEEDELDFASGLNFPAINASESSDEEFDLHRASSRPVRRRKKQAASKSNPDDVGSHDDEFVVLQ